MDLAEVKRRARGQAAKRRGEAHLMSGETAPLILARRGLPFEQPPDRRTVSAFHPYKDEISTLPLLGVLASEGWATALPVVVGPGQPLVFRLWAPGSPTVPGIWNIPMPPEESAVAEPDVLLVPLLAFDRQGYRLGYGGGFYDRTLAMLRAKKPVIAIGVAYAGQEMPAIPRGSFDQPMDWIMTERETLRCA